MWCFNCVGVVLICLILNFADDGSFHFLDLEDGTVHKYWRCPIPVGWKIGQWHKWEA